MPHLGSREADQLRAVVAPQLSPLRLDHGPGQYPLRIAGPPYETPAIVRLLRRCLSLVPGSLGATAAAGPVEGCHLEEGMWLRRRCALEAPGPHRIGAAQRHQAGKNRLNVPLLLQRRCCFTPQL